MKGLLILIAVIALPIAEIWLAIWLAGQWGWSVVLIGFAVFFGLGLAMVQRASLKWRLALRKAEADPGYLQGKFSSDLGDSALVLTGGILMLIPGFITGALGLLLVIPWVRAMVRKVFAGRIDQAASARGYRKVTIIEGETVVSETYVNPQPEGSSHTQRSEAPRIITGEIVAKPDDEPGASS